MEEEQVQEVEENIVEEPSFFGTISETIGSLFAVVQQNIIGRIEEFVDQTLEQAKDTAMEVMHNALLLLIIVLLGLIGFVFAIVGTSLWLGEVSGFGAWFGFLIVGVIIFIIALIIGLVQKNKQKC